MLVEIVLPYNIKNVRQQTILNTIKEIPKESLKKWTYNTHTIVTDKNPRNVIDDFGA
jgi:hypothetical protein